MILTQHHGQNLGFCLKPAFPTFHNGSCNHDFNTLHSVNSQSKERGKDGAKRQLRKTPPLVDFALGEMKTGSTEKLLVVQARESWYGFPALT